MGIVGHVQRQVRERLQGPQARMRAALFRPGEQVAVCGAVNTNSHVS